MKKVMISVLICMLMIASTVVSVSGTVPTKDSSQYGYSQAIKILDAAKIKLDAVRTKQEAVTVVKEIIVELNNHGLLPKGMTVGLAQRLITQDYLHSQFLTLYQNSNGNTTGNSNCLVIGIANQTFFRPFPAILDIPLIDRLAFSNNSLLNLLGWPYAIRSMQPLKFGPYAYFGDRYKIIKNGNTTEDIIQPASGWIWTYGANGPQKWNGTFYGSLSIKYQNTSYNGTTNELWHPIGIRGFVGINFLGFKSLSGGLKLPSIYIGFARKVNMTYIYPWS